MNDLVQWLLEHREEIIIFARGRHVWGHYRYGDKNLLEWDADELRCAILEELADAVVYGTRIRDIRQES